MTKRQDQPPAEAPASEHHLREQRLQKLDRIGRSGANPWPTRYERTHTTAQARAAYTSDEDRTPARLAGRLVAFRDLGGLTFGQIKDGAGKLQISFHREDPGYEELRDLDMGDFVGVSGWLWRTKRGEITLRVQDWQLLAKSLRPLPEKWHGLQDPEKRYRQRYLDLIANDEVREVFAKRTRIVRAMRRFLDERGFVEVETPALQPLYGGAAAKPFVTHHNALDRDLFLRISDELYLKRLIIGGFDKVYEIAKDFRNEGIDARHNPEFTMMELYQAYGDYRSMMDLTEGMILACVDALGGGYKRPYGEHVIDFTPPWKREKYADLFQEHVGVDMGDRDAVKRVAEARHIPTAGREHDVLVHHLFEECVEKHLEGPVFVHDYPAALCPLTKRKRDNPAVAERFELYVRCMELANAYTELNDPITQEETFRRQLAGLPEEESMAKMDEDFVRALRHGMPPAGGLGVGIDRLVMLLTDTQTIRDVILFPLLRPEKTT